MHKRLQELLQRTFDDKKIDSEEKVQLFQEFTLLDRETRAYVRNRAFDIATDACQQESPTVVLKWLETVVRTLDSSVSNDGHCEAFFSPGMTCRDALVGLISHAKSSLDICVFTISDDYISKALLAAHNRDVDVRIITDNDKTFDIGSDIKMLSEKGIAVRIDNTRHHMHHKFAVADKKNLAIGSFNWTKSASRYNHENLVVLDKSDVVKDFIEEFDRLWLSFS